MTRKDNFSIRLATELDISELLALDQACWPTYLCLTEERIRKRLKNYPEGQFVVLHNNQLGGCLYTQRINNILELEKIKFDDLESRHVGRGQYLQLLSINTHPSFQKAGFGDKLRNFALQHARLSGITSVVGITRCLHYDKTLTYENYVTKTKGELPIDPILRFHVSGGAKIKCIVTNFRPEDVDNVGHGILIEYVL